MTRSATTRAASLRYDRPQSAAEEQNLLDLVRKQLECERVRAGSAKIVVKAHVDPP